MVCAFSSIQCVSIVVHIQITTPLCFEIEGGGKALKYFAFVLWEVELKT